jgi:HEAT repeat protein
MLERALEHEEPLVREHAAWALEQLAARRCRA